MSFETIILTIEIERCSKATVSNWISSNKKNCLKFGIQYWMHSSMHKIVNENLQPQVFQSKDMRCDSTDIIHLLHIFQWVRVFSEQPAYISKKISMILDASLSFCELLCPFFPSTSKGCGIIVFDTTTWKRNRIKEHNSTFNRPILSSFQ